MYKQSEFNEPLHFSCCREIKYGKARKEIRIRRLLRGRDRNYFRINCARVEIRKIPDLFLLVRHHGNNLISHSRLQYGILYSRPGLLVLWLRNNDLLTMFKGSCMFLIKLTFKRNLDCWLWLNLHYIKLDNWPWHVLLIFIWSGILRNKLVFGQYGCFYNSSSNKRDYWTKAFDEHIEYLVNHLLLTVYVCEEYHVILCADICYGLCSDHQT